MESIKVLVGAICPHCGSRKTARGGYIRQTGSSAWKCRDDKCGKSFTIKTFIFQKEP